MTRSIRSSRVGPNSPPCPRSAPAIEHFFTRYKDLEPGKWVKVLGWGDSKAACAAIEAAIKNYEASKQG